MLKTELLLRGSNILWFAAISSIPLHDIHPFDDQLTESSSAIFLTDCYLKQEKSIRLLYSLPLSFETLKPLLIWWCKLHIYNANSIASASYHHMYGILHR
jgi:hypothetical protein